MYDVVRIDCGRTGDDDQIFNSTEQQDRKHRQFR